jgi:hypothetical protein
MSVSFPIPKGYSAPDGVKEGQEFTEIASFKFEGKDMTLLSVGEDKTPITSKDSKPKGAKDAIKDQLSALEDKEGSEKMEDTGDVD